MTCDEFRVGIQEDGELERAMDTRLVSKDVAGPIIDLYADHMGGCTSCTDLGRIFEARLTCVNQNIL